MKKSLTLFMIGSLFLLSHCKDNYINLSQIPKRENPRIPLSEVNTDLQKMIAENRQQKEFGAKALGPSSF
tara:strand:+ start:378 stop:587 length:210 start_codon:yes stop_codon:yes gene_type:complete